MSLLKRRRRTDEELLAATATDPAAFGELYDRYERPLLAYMARRTATPEVAADLTAEVFTAALSGAAGFQARDGASAIGWLFGIARNVLATSYRHQRVVDDARRRIGIDGPAVDDRLAAEIERLGDLEDGRCAMAVLATLPAAQREAVTAHVLHDRDYAEIAVELHCSTAVVRQRVSRGLTTIRKQVQHP